MSLVCEMWMCAYRYRHAADRGAPNDQTLDMLYYCIYTILLQGPNVRSTPKPFVHICRPFAHPTHIRAGVMRYAEFHLLR